MSFIPLDRYTDILKDLPIFCVDIVIKNDQEEYLLIKRNNEPKKGEWWVIGGRVLKGETAKDQIFSAYNQGKTQKNSNQFYFDIGNNFFVEIANSYNPTFKTIGVSSLTYISTM